MKERSSSVRSFFRYWDAKNPPTGKVEGFYNACKPTQTATTLPGLARFGTCGPLSSVHEEAAERIPQADLPMFPKGIGSLVSPA